MALDYKNSINRYRRYLQVMKDKPMWKSSMFLILTLILLLIMVIFALRPTLIKVASLVSEVGNQKELADKLDNKINAVERATELLELRRSRLGLLDESLPKNPNWEEWARSIEQRATESGVVIVNVSIGEAEIIGKVPVVKLPNQPPTLASDIEAPLPEDVQGISFSVTTSGQYDQLKNFIAEFEKMRRLVVLTEVQITKEKDGSLKSIVRGVIGQVKEEQVQ